LSQLIKPSWEDLFLLFRAAPSSLAMSRFEEERLVMATLSIDEAELG
jgi:hypothetical protein